MPLSYPCYAFLYFYVCGFSIGPITVVMTQCLQYNANIFLDVWLIKFSFLYKKDPLHSPSFSYNYWWPLSSFSVYFRVTTDAVPFLYSTRYFPGKSSRAQWEHGGNKNVKVHQQHWITWIIKRYPQMGRLHKLLEEFCSGNSSFNTLP